jgi:hypothetical protein
MRHENKIPEKQSGQRHNEGCRKQPLYAPRVELQEGKRTLLERRHNNLGDQKARDNIKNINADKATWQICSRMKKDNREHSDGPKTIDFRTISQMPLMIDSRFHFGERRIDSRPGWQFTGVVVQSPAGTIMSTQRMARTKSRIKDQTIKKNLHHDTARYN